MGSQILIGRRNGEGNFGKIGDIVIQGALFLLIPAILLVPLLRYGAVKWLPDMLQSENVANAAAEYLKWRIFGIVFAFVNAMFRAFYIGIARTKVLTANAVVMALVNVVFDYGLIFGNLGDAPPDGHWRCCSCISNCRSVIYSFFSLSIQLKRWIWKNMASKDQVSMACS